MFEALLFNAPFTFSLFFALPLKNLLTFCLKPCFQTPDLQMAIAILLFSDAFCILIPSTVVSFHNSQSVPKKPDCCYDTHCIGFIFISFSKNNFILDYEHTFIRCYHQPSPSDARPIENNISRISKIGLTFRRRLKKKADNTSPKVDKTLCETKRDTPDNDNNQR